MRFPQSRVAVWLPAIALLGGVGFLAHTSTRAFVRRLNGHDNLVTQERLARLRTDHTELALVFLTSSTCSAAEDPDLPWQLDSLRVIVEQRALRTGLGFTSIAIAVDLAPSQGLTHLRRFHGFDEVSAGRGTLGTAAQHYFGNDLKGLRATPSIVLLVRRVDGASRRAVYNERVLQRFNGLAEIQRWFDDGAPIELEKLHARTDSASSLSIVVPARP